MPPCRLTSSIHRRPKRHSGRFPPLRRRVALVSHSVPRCPGRRLLEDDPEQAGRVKRELLVAGQETLSRLLTKGIAEAPETASPLEAVAAGLERASSAMGPSASLS